MVGLKAGNVQVVEVMQERRRDVIRSVASDKLARTRLINGLAEAEL